MQALLLVFSRPVRWLLAVCLSTVLMACASVGGPKMVNHAFNFDGHNDGWSEQVDLLAFSYGDQYQRVRNSVEAPRSSVFAGMAALPPP